MKHDLVEKNIGLMGILVALVVSFGGLAEIVPLMASRTATEPLEGMQPYTAAQLEGRDIYIREGCYNCHSQMVRPFRAETERYGHYSVAAETVWDHPFQFGSKRTGPDLARVGEMVRLGGALNGRQIVPASWIEDMRTEGSYDVWQSADEHRLFPGGRYRSKWYQTGNEHDCMCYLH